MMRWIALIIIAAVSSKQVSNRKRDTQMKLSQYRVVTEKTNLELFNDGDDAVVIESNGDQKTIRTFTSGSVECLYCGESLEAARTSLELSNDDWDSLLSQDVEYLHRR